MTDKPYEKMHYMSSSIEFDRDKCIRCTKCVLKCKTCSVNYLTMRGEGKPQDKWLDAMEGRDCINCGQCTLVCPVGAIREQSSIEAVKEAINDKDKIVIVQAAPSVRASIGECFSMENNKNLELKINTACRLLGFDKVFDVNFGADITTLVEAEELLERLEDSSAALPMFTACCPAWVEYVEKYRPELKPNLTTARSPHIHSGGAYKTWWAKMNGVDPKNIVVVSLMPCTAKKHESDLEKFKINGLKPVDYTLTVREFAKMIKEANIDFANLEETEADTLGEYSGAGAIYGVSGGVMESALRTAYFITKGENMPAEELEKLSTVIRTDKKAEVEINGKKVRVAIVATVQNVEKILGELKENPDAYHYIEVMACAGGCINGGGQPLAKIKPQEQEEVIQKRRAILYGIDKNKTAKRNAYDNVNVKEYMKWLKEEADEELKHSLLHTEY